MIHPLARVCVHSRIGGDWRITNKMKLFRVNFIAVTPEFRVYLVALVLGTKCELKLDILSYLGRRSITYGSVQSFIIIINH